MTSKHWMHVAAIAAPAALLLAGAWIGGGLVTSKEADLRAQQAAAQIVGAARKDISEEILKVSMESAAKYLAEHPEAVVETLKAMEIKKAEERARLGADKRVLLEDPAGGLAYGPADAKIVVVEFFDYNCGYCRKNEAEIRKVLAERPEIRFVARDFPVLSPSSRDAAILAQAAARIDPDGAKRLHKAALDVEPRVLLTKEIMLRLAGESGLDPAEVLKAAQQPEALAPIAATLSLGRDLEVSGTPTFFINGRRIDGFLSAGQMAAALDRAAAENASASAAAQPASAVPTSSAVSIPPPATSPARQPEPDAGAEPKKD